MLIVSLDVQQERREIVMRVDPDVGLLKSGRPANIDIRRDVLEGVRGGLRVKSFSSQCRESACRCDTSREQVAPLYRTDFTVAAIS